MEGLAVLVVRQVLYQAAAVLDNIQAVEVDMQVVEDHLVPEVAAVVQQ
jgi:hypothetical protein